MRGSLEQKKDDICKVLSEIASRPDFPDGSAFLATASLISALAEYIDELPPEYLKKMLPALAMLYLEVVAAGLIEKDLIKGLRK